MKERDSKKERYVYIYRRRTERDRKRHLQRERQKKIASKKDRFIKCFSFHSMMNINNRLARN